MNAFLIVCPHCQSKYQVASADVQGKTVTCKKCSQKFAAKVMRATPKAAPPAAPTRPAAAQPVVDDPFGDLISEASSMPSSASPLGASALGAFPRKKKSNSFNWIPIAIGGGVVAVVLVLVIVAVSFLPSMVSGGLGGGLGSSEAARQAEADFAAHSKIAKQQVEVLTEFVVAIESVQQEADVPALIQKIEALSARNRSQAEVVRSLPKLSEEQNEQLIVSFKPQTTSLVERMKAAGPNLASFQTPSLMKAMIDFQNTGREFGEAIAAAQPRKVTQPVAQVDVQQAEADAAARIAERDAERAARKAEREAKIADFEAKVLAAETKAAEAQAKRDAVMQANAAAAESDVAESGSRTRDNFSNLWDQQVNVAGRMFDIHDEMVSAVAATSPANDVPALVQKLRAWTAQFRELADEAIGIRVLTREQSARLAGSIDSRLKEFNFEGGATVQKLQEYKSPELMAALVDYLAAAADVRQAVIATTPMGTVSASVSVDLAKHREFLKETMGFRQEHVEIDYSFTSADDPNKYIAELDKLTQRVNDLNKTAKDAYGLSKLLQDCVGLEMLAEVEAFAAGIDAERLTEKLKNRKYRTPQVKAAREKLQTAFNGFYTVLDNQKLRDPNDVAETPSSNKPMSAAMADAMNRFGGPRDVESIRGMGMGGRQEVDEDAAVQWAKEKKRKLEEAQQAQAVAAQGGGGTSGRSGLGPTGPGPEFGPGPGPGPGFGMEPRPGFGPPPANAFRDRVGADKMVTLFAPMIKREQIKWIITRLESELENSNYSGHSSGGQGTMLELEYSGDIQELAKQIDFGEVEEVNVAERQIRLKSISISE